MGAVMAVQTEELCSHSRRHLNSSLSRLAKVIVVEGDRIEVRLAKDGDMPEAKRDRERAINATGRAIKKINGSANLEEQTAKLMKLLDEDFRKIADDAERYRWMCEFLLASHANQYIELCLECGKDEDAIQFARNFVARMMTISKAELCQPVSQNIGGTQKDQSRNLLQRETDILSDDASSSFVEMPIRPQESDVRSQNEPEIRYPSQGPNSPVYITDAIAAEPDPYDDTVEASLEQDNSEEKSQTARIPMSESGTSRTSIIRSHSESEVPKTTKEISPLEPVFKRSASWSPGSKYKTVWGTVSQFLRSAFDEPWQDATVQWML